MEKYHDREIKFLTRGDDIEMLNEAILLAQENELLLSYLCYFKNTILYTLDDIDFPKEEYPIGSKKGMTWDEII